MNYVITDRDFGANGWRTQESVDRETRFWFKQDVIRFIKDTVFYIAVAVIAATINCWLYG